MSYKVEVGLIEAPTITDKQCQRLLEICDELGVRVESHDEDFINIEFNDDPSQAFDDWAKEFKLSFRFVFKDLEEDDSFEVQYMFGKYIEEPVSFFEVYEINDKDSYDAMVKYARSIEVGYSKYYYNDTVYYLRCRGGAPIEGKAHTKHYPSITPSTRFLTSKKNETTTYTSNTQTKILGRYDVNYPKELGMLPASLISALNTKNARYGYKVYNYLRKEQVVHRNKKGDLLFNRNTLGVYEFIGMDDNQYKLKTVYHPNYKLHNQVRKQATIHNYTLVAETLPKEVYQLIFNDINRTSLYESKDAETPTVVEESLTEASKHRQLDELVEVFCSDDSKELYSALSSGHKDNLVDILPSDVDDLMLEAVISSIHTSSYYPEFVVSIYDKKIHKEVEIGRCIAVPLRCDAEYVNVTLSTREKYPNIFTRIMKRDDFISRAEELQVNRNLNSNDAVTAVHNYDSRVFEIPPKAPKNSCEGLKEVCYPTTFGDKFGTDSIGVAKSMSQTIPSCAILPVEEDSYIPTTVTALPKEETFSEKVKRLQEENEKRRSFFRR